MEGAGESAALAGRVGVRERLALALARCGYPPPRASRRLGAGAWHDAYLARTGDGRRLVVRLRKPVIYGRREAYDERLLRSDYAGVGAYYQEANRCRPGVCPAEYAYAIGPTLSCTVESYLGPALALGRLAPAVAREVGRAAGDFFRAMHARPPRWPGSGELVWAESGLRGEDGRSPEEVWHDRVASRRAGLDRLAAAGFALDRAALRPWLDLALAERGRPESPSLVDGDVTPENLIVRRGRFVGLVDPVPRLDGGTRYAAFFLVCYRLLLPALHDAPRYARRHFDRHAPVLARISDGYLAGYLRDTDGRDEALARALGLEYALWVLDLAVAGLDKLEQPLDEERRLRTGGEEAIARRVRLYLRELQTLAADEDPAARPPGYPPAPIHASS